MRAYALTDQGKKRTSNQDSYYIPDAENLTGNKIIDNLYIIADGMGGHKGGDTASRLAIESVIGYITRSKRKNIEKILVASVLYANKKIYELSMKREDLRGMGTTLSLIYIDPDEDKAYMVNIGDSRIYLVSKENIKQLSTDDTYVSSLVKGGFITKEQATTHPRKNVLTKALGTATKIDFSISNINIDPSWTILMCSDGLTGMLTDTEIFNIVSKYTGDNDHTCKKLIEKANKNGGTDNITVIIIQVSKECV